MSDIIIKDKIIDEAIRRVHDFPKPGICFYDITGILSKPKVFKYCINKMVNICRNMKIDAIAAIEARGFVFAAPIAEYLELPLILIRKKGKLPGAVYSSSYALEYGEATIEVHKSDVVKDTNVLIIDDLIATGGTLDAARKMINEGGAKVTGFLGVVGLPFLNYEKMIGDCPVHTLIQFESE